MLDAIKDIIDVFEKIIFPYKGNVFKAKEEKSEEKSKKERVKKFVKYIENESNIINYDLIKKHFNFAAPSALVKQLYVTKNRKKNNGLVNVIKSGLSDSKDEIKKKCEDEKEIEKPDKTLKTVEKNS